MLDSSLVRRARIGASGCVCLLDLKRDVLGLAGSVRGQISQARSEKNAKHTGTNNHRQSRFPEKLVRLPLTVAGVCCQREALRLCRTTHQRTQGQLLGRIGERTGDLQTGSKFDRPAVCSAGMITSPCCGPFYDKNTIPAHVHYLSTLIVQGFKPDLYIGIRFRNKLD